MIDRHYKKLKYEPIEFIQNNRLDYISGNLVKYVSRFYTIDRADADKEANLTRIKFYLKRALLEYDKELTADYKPFLSRISTNKIKEYCKINKFDKFQSDLLINYFKATLNKSSHEIKIILDNI